MTRMRMQQILSVLTALLLITACSKSEPSPAKNEKKTTEPEKETKAPSTLPKSVDLGQKTIQSFTVKASRDAGAVKAGEEIHLDIDCTGAAFNDIRAWFGLADGKASLRALGDVEHEDRPNHRHFHVRVPNPIPDGSKIHVEVEAPDGSRHTVDFEPKM